MYTRNDEVQNLQIVGFGNRGVKINLTKHSKCIELC